MRFRFVAKSMTLDDLERPKSTLAEKIVLRNPQKSLIEDRPKLSAAKYSPIRICGYSWGFLGEGPSNDSGVVDTGHNDVDCNYLLNCSRDTTWRTCLSRWTVEDTGNRAEWRERTRVADPSQSLERFSA